MHNDGEIWAATLWDLRKSLGQAMTDLLVIDGLKSTPCNPSMTDARDAIFSADQAVNGGANRAAIWQVFAKHGMGYSALGSMATTRRARGTTRLTINLRTCKPRITRPSPATPSRSRPVWATRTHIR